MTIDEIKEIIQLLNESGMAEIEVQRGENRVWIKRSGHEMHVSAAASPMTMPGPMVYHQAPQAAPAPHVPAAKPEETLPVVKAPIVGTFYESPSPGAGSFVKPGDTVQAGQVLCIIESMKLMNEIEADAAGVIVAKLVPNGKPVEYGEALFTYRPL
jgi:acetyl-CoA carboxylase biotin carboxyl carrier protein